VSIDADNTLVRRWTEEGYGGGNLALVDELFATAEGGKVVVRGRTEAWPTGPFAGVPPNARSSRRLSGTGRPSAGR